MDLTYGDIDPTEPSTIPPRKVNGGLYTGETATGDWRCYPVVPEAHIYTTQNLRSANPPPRGTDTIAGGNTRIGNSTQVFPNHKKYNDTLNIYCISTE